MTSTYESIYSRFLSIISGYDLASLSEDDAYASMYEWFTALLGKPIIRKLFSKIAIDDDKQEVTYTLASSIDDLYDKNFVESMFAHGMVVEWLGPKLETETLINQFFGETEQKFYAQSNQLSAVQNLYEYSNKILEKKYVTQHGYYAQVMKGK